MTTIKSILAVECGNSTTTAVFLEYSMATFKILATGQVPSTFGPPWQDITLGVQGAVRHIEKTLGRTLLTPAGWPITPQNPARQGVDAFVVVSSAGPPLTVMLAGLIQEVSLASAQRVAAATYTRVINTLSLDADNGNSTSPFNAQIQAILKEQPEVILLVGGTDGGAEEPLIDIANVIAAAMMVHNAERPTVLYAGNTKLRTHMADLLGSLVPLRSINNVRPTLDIEDLAPAQKELENIYLERKMLQLPGFDRLKNWSQYNVVPVSKSFERLIGYLGQHNNLNVLGANIGSRSTLITAKRGKELNTTIRSDVGMGHSLGTLLNEVSVEHIHRWLPFELSVAELTNQLLNKRLHPTTIPTSPEDMMIEHAIAREALRLVLRQSQPDPLDQQWNLIVGAGRTITGTPQAAQAALLLLDGLEPWGVTSLALDKNGVVNMLGAIAIIEPMAAVQIARRETFLNLGTVVAPAGVGQYGKLALKIKLTRNDNQPPVEKEIMFGQLELLPLPEGEKASLEIRPARQFDIGLGQPGRGAVAQVEGGLLGIIIDARGRPIKLPADSAQRQEQLRQWLKTLKVNYATPVNQH